jgi:hypothetical protein
MQNDINVNQDKTDKTESNISSLLTKKQKALTMLNFKTAKKFLENVKEEDKVRVKSLILDSIKDSKVKISLNQMMKKI